MTCSTRLPRVPAAALFDMDGVVTDTANAHAAAWRQLFDEYLRQRAERTGEPFRGFDIGSDYRRHVDGKPRSAGVADFLASRGIELPPGDVDDGPEQETVHGLGNRKDGYFNAWLQNNQVRTYPGTLALIQALRAAGCRIVVFSASRNAGQVLRNAGVLDRFDAKFDGRDLAQTGLPGKPDPAMLLEAAALVGAAPADCVVFEDAIAGVEAGARGGFGCVVGVDRSQSGTDHQAAGADIVVCDLAELQLDPARGLAVKMLDRLPSLWQREDETAQRLAGHTPVVFIDYDGTLTPIVEDHSKAFLADDMRAALDALARCCPVVVVSGRDLGRLHELVQLDDVYLAGSHGFEIRGPAGSGIELQQGVEFLPDLGRAERALRDDLAEIPGHSLERKKFSIAVHYRQVAAADVGELRAVVDDVLVQYPRLQLGHGKKVLELRPGIEWNKGEAVLWLLQQLGLDRAGCVPLYLGDDITDEDAFRALAGRGLCIGVRDGQTRPTAADLTVANTGEVKRLLEWLAGVAARSAPASDAGERK